MEAIDRVLSSSVRAQSRSVDSVFKNLVEEVGETAIGEVADVINCVVDLVYMMEVESLARQGIGEKAINVPRLKRRIENWVDHKCNKWDGLVEGMKQ